MEENNSNSSYKMVNNYLKKEKKVGAGKTIVVPFISGVVGACLTLGVCFNVPTIKTQFLGLNSEPVSAGTTETPTISTSGKLELTSHADVGAYAASKILPSIVGITVEFQVNSIFGQQGTAKAGGSGIILSEDGYIITNNHVVNTSSSVSNGFYQVSDATKITVQLYNNDETYEAKVVGTYAISDLAILKIDKTGLTPAELGNSDDLKMGEFALVAGNPLGFDFSVTTGSISSVNRQVTDDEGKSYTVIQTDAAINSGNSGGALVNSEGKVVGISFMKIASSSVEGICFAIPITPNLDAINQLIQNGFVKLPYIGISGTDVDRYTSQRYGIPVGIYVQEVDSESNAAKTGLQYRDVIIKIDDVKVSSMDELNAQKYKKQIGDTIKLTVNRNGEELEFEIVLTEMPNE